MKKIIKAFTLVVGATVVGAIIGNLLGRLHIETPVIVAVIVAMYTSLYGHNIRSKSSKNAASSKLS